MQYLTCKVTYVTLDFMNCKDFAKRVREKRKEKGLTQQQLANLSHVSRMTIYRLEAGKVKPAHNNRIKILEVLEMEDLEKNELQVQ